MEIWPAHPPSTQSMKSRLAKLVVVLGVAASLVTACHDGGTMTVVNTTDKALFLYGFGPPSVEPNSVTRILTYWNTKDDTRLWVVKATAKGSNSQPNKLIFCHMYTGKELREANWTVTVTMDEIQDVDVCREPPSRRTSPTASSV